MAVRRPGSAADKLLQYEADIKDNVPVLDISIHYSNSDVSGISERVHGFLKGEGASDRTAYICALCIEELAADMVGHTLAAAKAGSSSELMDIKLFSDPESFKIVLRNIAKPYNPLDFEYDNGTFAKIGTFMAQELAGNITYNYVYKMNIIDIEIGK